MKDVNEKIDEYLYPQSSIYRRFGIPPTLYSLELVDYRKYYWYDEQRNIMVATGVDNNGHLVGGWSLEPKDDKIFSCDCLCIKLIRTGVWSSIAEKFVVFSRYNQLVKRNEKFVLLTEYK